MQFVSYNSQKPVIACLKLLQSYFFKQEKFTQFKNTVSNAAKLLHSVCGQLIDISANFEYASEFFQNLQSISLSKPSTLAQNVTMVRR